MDHHHFPTNGPSVALAILAVVVAVVLGIGILNSGDPAPGDDQDSGATEQSTGAEQSSAETDPPEPSGADLAQQMCDSAAPSEVTGNVANPDVVEASGLVASTIHDDVLWTHNDSGADPVLFAVGTDGSDRGSFTVEGAEARDWEDIAAWVDPGTGVSYLYLADTGDFRLPDAPGESGSQRDSVTVYRVPEPTDLTAASTEPTVAFELAYPDEPHDSEALLVAPDTGDLHLLTKGWDGDGSTVYRAADPQADRLTVMQEVATIPLDSLGDLVTGADLHRPGAGSDTAADESVDGGVVVVRTYASVLVFPLSGEGIAASLAQDSCEGPSEPENQGEAIAVSSAGDGYFTVSEGQGPPLHWFPAAPA